jgi:8-hydroxy-5-deazaflavin:NADPH oxidoreductase
MKIGIIGAGNIGGTLGRLWVQAGHLVRFGVHDPSKALPLLDELGSGASAGSAFAAAAFGEVVVYAGPYGAWPQLAGDLLSSLKGKVLVDAANPYPPRDGAMVEDVARMGRGAGSFTASLLPGARVVKSFNTIYWLDLRDKAFALDQLLAMPMAGDDAAALAIVGELARDAGFDPVIVGGLDRSADLDPQSPIYAKSFTAELVRKALALPHPPSSGA